MHPDFMQRTNSLKDLYLKYDHFLDMIVANIKLGVRNSLDEKR